MTRRRIAFNLAFVERGPLTGPGYYAIETFRAMQAIVALTRPDIQLLAFIKPDAAHHIADLPGEVVVDIKRAGDGRVRRVLWEQTLLPIAAWRHRVDLLFSPAFVSPLWGVKNPVVGICDMYYAVIPDMLDPMQRRYWSTFIPPSARRSRRILAISQHTANDIQRIIPATRGKVSVTPLASRMTPREPLHADPPWEPYVLMVANLTPNKNVEVVVEALSNLRCAGIDLKLVHVGRDDGNRVHAAARQFGVLDAVDQLGKVSDARLEALYRNAFVAVNASLYEGFGMPAVEAQAMGAPLVSSNHPALMEAAGRDGALFYDPRRPDMLEARIAELWRDPQLRRQLRDRGIRNAARLSWHSTAMLTLAVFDDVLGGAD